MRLPQIKIFQEASYKTIETEFNAWVVCRLKEIKDLPEGEQEDALGIPSETHLQYDQGLQKYIFTVVYMSNVPGKGATRLHGPDYDFEREE